MKLVDSETHFQMAGFLIVCILLCTQCIGTWAEEEEKCGSASYPCVFVLVDDPMCHVGITSGSGHVLGREPITIYQLLKDELLIKGNSTVDKWRARKGGSIASGSQLSQGLRPYREFLVLSSVYEHLDGAQYGYLPREGLASGWATVKVGSKAC